MRIVAVGECTRDRYIDHDVERIGGISLNFAINARRSGAEHVAIVSCIGTDGANDAIRAKLTGEDIDATHLHVQSGMTASQVIRLSRGGERVFPPNGYSAGVLATFLLDATDLAYITTFDVVAAPYFRQVKQLFGLAMEAAANATRVADLLDGEDLGSDLAGIDPLLDTLDLAFISGDERTVELLLPRSRLTRTLIVITHGAAGSTALMGGRRYVEPAIAVPVDEQVDTTGCGDAFQAAFTVDYLRRGAVPHALRAGATRAAEVIRHVGATGA